MTKIAGIEGEGTVKTISNIFGDPTNISLHFADGTLYSSATYSYNGLGRLASQAGQLEGTTSYRVNSFDRIIQTNFPKNRVIKIQYVNQTTTSLPISMQLNDSIIDKQLYNGLE